VWRNNYDETYAPVSKHATLRTFLAVAARRGWKVHQLDVKTAFLHGDVDVNVYMQQPPGFEEGSNLVCLLKKCLYGLKQAPLAWYRKLTSLLRELGFLPVSADLSFWYCRNVGCIVYLTSVVDDMLIASCNAALTLSIVKKILHVFPGTYKGVADHFVGMKLTWLPDEHAVILNQPAHVDQLLQRFKPANETWYPRSLPMLGDLKLCAAGTNLDKTGVPLDTTRYHYRGLIGGLNYLACCTRPDIAYTVGQLAKFANSPTNIHWDVAIDCLKYLMGTKHLGIKLGHVDACTHPSTEESFPSVTYVDSSYAPGIDDTKSVTGYALFVHGGPVMWASRTQHASKGWPKWASDGNGTDGNGEEVGKERWKLCKMQNVTK
jgi:hypothetical protein